MLLCVHKCYNMAKIKIKKAATKGKNIRFSDKSYDLLKAFCDKKGYKLGSFCEIGALDKMKTESTNNL